MATRDPAPPVDYGTGRPVDPRAPLPARAALTGIGGLVAGNLLAIFGYAFGHALSPGSDALPIVASQLLLWGGMLGACWWVSRTDATGDVRADFAVLPRRSDIGWGVVFAVVDWIAATGVSRLVELLGPSYVGSNSDIVTDVRNDVPALVVTIVIAVVGAPIVEELFFRGLMQRAFQPWAGVAGAVVLQGLLFGGVHVAETTGAGRLGLWLALSAVGIVHGVVYQRFKRITVSMWTHAMFNLGGVVLIFTATLHVR